MIARRGRKLVLSLLLLVVAGAFLLPQLWLVSLSLKSKAGVYEYPPRLFPADSSAANYRFVLSRTQVPGYLVNSGRVAIVATALTIVIGAPAAFVLSRSRFRRRGRVRQGRLLAPMV